MDKKTQFSIWYWIGAFFLLMTFQYLFTTATQVAQIPYSEFQIYLSQGRIAEVAVSDRFIQGRFNEPVDGRPMFVTTRVEPDLARDLQQHGVVVTGQIESIFLRDLLSWIVPVAPRRHQRLAICRSA
jgi:cell division protease FtsH